MEGFDFELTNETRRAIEELGYEQPTPIQALTIEPMLAGRDLIGLEIQYIPVKNGRVMIHHIFR